MTINQYKNIRPLVIGIGVAGRRHLEAQLNLGIRTGAYTTNHSTTESLRGQNNVIVFDNLEKAIEWSNLVHVCTPDDKHTEFVAEALKRKKTVLCEKSFTTSLADALYLQTLAHQYNATVIIGQNYRLTPSFTTTKRMVSERQFGNITGIKVTYLHDKADFQKRYSDQDFLYMGGSHAIDLACWIAGEPVTNITANLKAKLSYKIILKFASGLEGNIILDASSTRSKSGTDLIVSGERGKLLSHNKSDKLFFYKSASKQPLSIQLPNKNTYTIPLEVKIVDDYLCGKTTSLWPLPNLNESVNLVKLLDATQKIISLGKNEAIL